MNPIKFKEHNAVYAEDQPEYLPFPVLRTDNQVGELIGCWRLSFRERVRVLFTGIIWHSMWTYGNPLQPQRLTTKKTEVLETRP